MGIKKESSHCKSGYFPYIYLYLYLLKALFSISLVAFS